MDRDRSRPEVPAGLERVTPDEFSNLDTDELTALAEYVQGIVDARDDIAEELGIGEDEVLTKVLEHDGYLEIHKKTPCDRGCDDCPHGPYIYHVRREPRPSGETNYHWSYIGLALDSA